MNRNFITWLIYSLFVSLLIWGGINRTQVKNLITPNSENNSIDSDNTPVIDIINLQVTVIDQNSESVTLATTEKNNTNSTIQLSRRPLRYAYSQGFSPNVGDHLELTGFMENNEFEIISIYNLKSQITTKLRDISGHPLWSGSPNY